MKIGLSVAFNFSGLGISKLLYAVPPSNTTNKLTKNPPLQAGFCTSLLRADKGFCCSEIRYIKPPKNTEKAFGVHIIPCRVIFLTQPTALTNVLALQKQRLNALASLCSFCS
jgi:hypothetical protein